MALIGVNPGRQRPERRTKLDKILESVALASKITGNVVDTVQSVKTGGVQRELAGAQTDKVNAEIGGIEANNAPPSEGLVSRLVEQGVPRESIPATTKDAQALNTKLFETPAQKASRVRAEASLEFAQNADERSRNKEQRDIAKIQRESDEKLDELTVPGVGVAYSATDAKELKSGVESKAQFDRKIQEMIDLRTKFDGGQIMDRAATARGKQLSKDLLLAYKNMAKLGVLSKSDEDIVNAIIPDNPLAYSPNPLGGGDPILTKLTAFKNDVQNDFNTTVKTRIKDLDSSFQVEGSLPGDIDGDGIVDEAEKWVMKNPDDPRVPAVIKKINQDRGRK